MKAIVVFLCSLCAALPVLAELDPGSARDGLAIVRKVHCSTVDGEAMTYVFDGRIYSRRMGERDKLLFEIEGMNVRACTSISDEKRGEGFKLVSREIMLYKDPATGEVLTRWDNPWTGETNEVLHVANDPVNFSSYEIGRDGKSNIWSGDVEGDLWRYSITVPLFYPNILGGDYQREIGGIYHATEMFNFFGTTAPLLSDNTTTVYPHIGWARVSDWLPWMNMSGREGALYVHASGRKLTSWNELSETMKSEVREHYPEYVVPPPVDDTRANETSWMYLKRLRDGERVAPERD